MDFNNCASTVELLLSRRSAKARLMVEPGPNQEELRQILMAGLRVPDHGKLAPWRFVVVQKPEQQALGALWAEEMQRSQSDAKTLDVDNIRAFPAQAPVMIAVISTAKPHDAIPLQEQRYSSAAACQNMLICAHALGYTGCWLTGWAAYAPGAIKILGGEDGDQVTGFLFLGRPSAPLSERPRPEFDHIVHFWRANS